MIPALDHRLSLLELKCRRPVEHLLAGEYRSVFRGQGLEFEDVRPYQPGDDVRSMEWKTTARTGTPHIKRCIEEREQFLYLLADISPSIVTPRSGRAREVMVELATLLAMAAVSNHDRVGLVMFSDRVEQVVPPAKGRSHVLRIIDSLLGCKPSGRGTHFQPACDYLGRMARKHSIVFVLSDFLAADYQRPLSVLAVRHDVNAIRLTDRRAQEAAQDELIHMEDAESGARAFIDHRTAGSHPADRDLPLHDWLLQHRVSSVDIDVEDDCVAGLARLFHHRERRLAADSGG